MRAPHHCWWTGWRSPLSLNVGTYRPPLASNSTASHPPQPEGSAAMDGAQRRLAKLVREPARRPSRAEAEAAVRVLIEWAGDDPGREGLKGTPARVARAFEEYFQGYGTDPVELLQRTF